MSRPNDYAPALEAAGQHPLFLQIARAVTRDIRRGRLAPGSRLPGSRELALRLGAHRNTVLSAYAELEQEGWLVTEPARGTFVASSLPEVKARPFTSDEAPRVKKMSLPALNLDLPSQVPEGALPLLAGLPDVRLMPVAALARAYRRAVTRDRRTLAYGSPYGDARLIRALSELLRHARGVVAEPGGLVVTRGSQMGLHLAARALLHPGDLVVVEGLGYRPAWQALRLAGAELIGVPLDRSGLRLDALARLAQTRRIGAVYVTPHHQYPTTVTMAAARRLELLSLAERHGFWVFEDDYDHEFHWSGRPVLPLASADPARLVVYLGTLSKLLAPGLRIGYVVARAEVSERMARLRVYLDRQGDHAVERAVAELMEDGELERHAKRVARAYAERRNALAEALTHDLGQVLSFELPRGGLGVYATVDQAIDVDAWAARALAERVLVQTGRAFAWDGRPRNTLRLGFPALEPKEIRRAVRLMAQVLRA
jgi:GntR family transcriptional regulator/MocR family aminotransferase